MKTGRTNEDWQKIFKLWKQSNLTQSQFCTEHRISIATFRSKLYKAKTTLQKNVFEEIQPQIYNFSKDIFLKFPQGIQIRFTHDCRLQTVQSIMKACYEVLCVSNGII